MINPGAEELDSALIARVYRYHLALCGDPVEAQQAAAGTLRRATRWKSAFDPQRASFVVWMFQFARYQQAFTRRRAMRTIRKRSQAAAAAAFAWPEDEVRARASAARLAEVLRGLPRPAAETLALSCFAGLEVEEIAAVTAKPPATTREQLSASLDLLAGRLGALPAGAAAGGMQAELRALAAQIQPEEAFVSAALAAWAARPVDRQRGGIWPPVEPGRWLYRARSAWQWGLRVAPVAFVAAALLLSALDAQFLTGFLRPARTPQAGAAFAAPTAVKGDMVPPPAAVCAKWKNEVATEVGLPAILIEDAVYNNPTTAGNAQNGLGCEVLITAGGGSFQGTQATLSVLADLLLLEGFRGDAKYTCPCGFSGNTLFGRDWYGWGMHMADNALNAVLTVSWRPSDAGLCVAGKPESQCNLPPDQQIVTVRLVLAQPARS